MILFFPPGPAITVTCGGGFNVKANVFLMFLSLKKKKENHKWKPADKAEPVTQASRHQQGSEFGHSCSVRLGGSAQEVTSPQKPMLMSPLRAELGDEALCTALTAVTGM